jgi:hypothetical protein
MHGSGDDDDGNCDGNTDDGFSCVDFDDFDDGYWCVGNCDCEHVEDDAITICDGDDDDDHNHGSVMMMGVTRPMLREDGVYWNTDTVNDDDVDYATSVVPAADTVVSMMIIAAIERMPIAMILILRAMVVLVER